ncbi:MAG: hypothetical protein R3245_11915, partial [Kiloniellales bacterium]|nr:hypothetical protein [Kiloniellales bacterium]
SRPPSPSNLADRDKTNWQTGEAPVPSLSLHGSMSSPGTFGVIPGHRFHCGQMVVEESQYADC